MSTHMQHSGRGGAGNLANADVEESRHDDPARDPNAFADFPPELHGPYSTGRGGKANVKKNDAGPHVARIAQDLEGPDRLKEDHRLLETAQYSGRGGAGNIAARRSEESSRTQTPRSGSQTPSHDKAAAHHEGLADKLKHALLGSSSRSGK